MSGEGSLKHHLTSLYQKLKLRTVVFHLIGQPWVKGHHPIRNALWRVFFGNKLFPSLGKYKFFGQSEIDRVLAQKLRKNGFFIEVGSNDGVSFSNCKHLELYCGWRGILIEPFKPNLELSRVHRAKTSSFVHAALVTSNHVGDSVELIYSNLMTTLSTPSNEVPSPEAHAELGRQFLGPGEKIHRFRAPARTLSEVLKSEKAPQVIDLLSIDIEGHDFEVLSDFDWSFQISHILVEAFDSEKMVQFLKSKGYQLVFRDNSSNLLFAHASTIHVN